MMRRDIFIPETLSAEEKVALFVEAINAQDMNAVVVSPQFFEEVKKNPKVTVEYRNDVRDGSHLINEAIDLLYRYEGITAYANEPATIDAAKVTEDAIDLLHKYEGVVAYAKEPAGANEGMNMIDNAIDLLYKYEGVVAYAKEPATIDGVKLFVKPIAKEFEIHN